MIARLLDIAADEARENHGRVPLDTMMRLDAAGYELAALDDDIANLNETEN